MKIFEIIFKVKDMKKWSNKADAYPCDFCHILHNWFNFGNCLEKVDLRWALRKLDLGSRDANRAAAHPTIRQYTNHKWIKKFKLTMLVPFLTGILATYAVHMYLWWERVLLYFFQWLVYWSRLIASVWKDTWWNELW